MNKDQIKQYLLENTSKIEEILEVIGCHDIKLIKDKRIQCGLPPSEFGDGDNKTSVQIKLDDFLSAKIYTRSKFSEYEIKDIFTIVQFIKDIKLNESIQLICDICGLKYSYSTDKKNISESYDFIKRLKKSIKKETLYEEVIIAEWFIKRFVREDCLMFLNDGVNSKSQEKFNVCYDVLDNRVVFPIRNDDGKLLSFKGRTCEVDYKIKDIPKFISYYPCNNNSYLFGFYENYYDLLSADEIIIIESEKGVMQLDSMEINNAVSINKKTISEMQLKKLLQLYKPITLAFDKDVTLEEIFIECKKFKGLCDVYYIYDTLGLLKEKESPVDKGLEVFNRLNNECKFKYEGV